MKEGTAEGTEGAANLRIVATELGRSVLRATPADRIRAVRSMAIKGQLTRPRLVLIREGIEGEERKQASLRKS